MFKVYTVNAHYMQLSSFYARNNTQAKSHLRSNGTNFKTLHSIGAGEYWKISSFSKTQNSAPKVRLIQKLISMCKTAQKKDGF